jgi:hypothetical protein
MNKAFQPLNANTSKQAKLAFATAKDSRPPFHTKGLEYETWYLS